MLKNIIIISVALSFLLPSFSFAQQQPQIKAPGTLEEAKNFITKILKGIPEGLKEVSKEALIIWQKMANWAKNLWDSYIFPWFQNIWQKIAAFFGKEIEQRKPIIEEEFQKEKEEMKEELPKVGKSLWERFKELIK